MAESPARTAFAEEALTHLDTLYRGALRLTRDPDSAQDLVQEAYLRALRYQHSYQAEPLLGSLQGLPEGGRQPRRRRRVRPLRQAARRRRQTGGGRARQAGRF